MTNLIEKFKFELFYKKEDQINLKIKNPDYLTKLKQIKSIILDKNQTITDNQLTISGLLIFNEFYEINDSEIPLLRDILSQAKNSQGYSFRDKKVESLKEIPFEDNDIDSKLLINPPLNPQTHQTNDTQSILNTIHEHTKSNNQTIPNFSLISETDENNPLKPVIRGEDFPTKNRTQSKATTINDEKTNKMFNGRLYSDLSIKPNKPFINLNSIKMSVFVDPSHYDSEGDETKKKGKDSNNYLRNYSTIYKPKSLKEMCQENFYEINELLKSLILCHFTKTKMEIKTSTFIHESIHQEIGSILEFCEKFGYSFKGSFKVTESKIHVYELNTGSQPEYYPIIGFNEFTKNRTRFSLLVGKPLAKNNEFDVSQGATLYVHGDDAEQMISILNLNSKDKEQLREKVEKLRETGNMTIVYAKREMSLEETKHYIKRKKIIKTSLTIKEEELESLYNSIEEKLDLICVLCTKEKLRPHVNQTITAFHEAQIKIYFVSADNESSTLASAFQSGIISNEVGVYKIQINNQNSALISLKWILQKLHKELILTKKISQDEGGSPRISESVFRDSFQKRVGFDEVSTKKGGAYGSKISENNTDDQSHSICVLIDGESFRIIYKNKYLRDHFLFLMMFCNNVCYDFSSVDKKRLAKLIRRLDNSTNNFVLGIGDGYDDVLMMQKCDISIELKNPENEIVSFMGDFIVDDFKKIADLILFRANELFIKNEEIMLYLFYVILALLFNIFFFSWFSGFTGSEMITAENFDVLTVIMSIQIIIVYFLFESKKTPFLTHIFPLLYKNDMRIKKIEFKRFWMKTVMPALIDSTLIFFFCYFSYGFFSGVINGLTQMNIIINISYYLLFCIRVNYLYL